MTPAFEDLDPMTITDPAPLGIGVYGYGGAGKTETALRLAFGIQRVYGGEVFYADTESRKGLVYRKMFPFRYIDFRAPHNALRYIELIKTFAGRKGVLVIDTFTEEHDGEGGMLETKEEAMYDRRGEYKDSRTPIAWALAKGQHKKLPRILRAALQTIPIVGTWRAEDKTDWNHKGDDGRLQPIPKGETPIGSRDIPFEMTLHFLMRAGAQGIPCLKPETNGEKIMTKIPRWFDGLFRPNEPITEAHGEALARWAMNEAKVTRPPAEAAPDVALTGEQAEIAHALQTRFRAADTIADVQAIAKEVARYPKGHPIRTTVNAAYVAAKDRCSGVVPASAEPPMRQAAEEG